MLRAAVTAGLVKSLLNPWLLSKQLSSSKNPVAGLFRVVSRKAEMYLLDRFAKTQVLAICTSDSRAQFIIIVKKCIRPHFLVLKKRQFPKTMVLSPGKSR